MRAFLAWVRTRHVEYIQLTDAYFEANAFEQELTTLPGKYSRPDGALLLAFWDREPAGCVALRRIDAQACEMKRMFLYPQFHGKGIGRALGEAIIREFAAVRKLEQLGYGYDDFEWIPPASATTAVTQHSILAEADALLSALVLRADALEGCIEGSEEEAELVVITDAIEAYETVRWPLGKEPGGKG